MAIKPNDDGKFGYRPPTEERGYRPGRDPSPPAPANPGGVNEAPPEPAKKD